MILAAASILSGCSERMQGYDARYVGAFPGCDMKTATLARRADRFVFTPGDGALAIEGPIGADGTFTGTLNTQPPGKPEFILRVEGSISVEQAWVDYVNPRCQTSTTLARVHPPLL